MRLSTFLLFICSFSVFSQNREITLEDIWSDDTFKMSTLEAFHSMVNGDYYTILNKEPEGTSLDKYSYSSLEKVETIVHGKDLPQVSFFDAYTFNQQENKLIIGIDLKKIYRRSKKGKYYVYDLNDKTLKLISKDEIQEPFFSPDGTKVAYAKNNNLYVKDLASDETIQVTTDGQKNFLINGICDWVYEEEFAFVRAFQWSQDSSKLAFIRFDESDTPEFSMDIFGKGLYPSQQTFKYPKPGEKGSKVSLHWYDLNLQKTFDIDLGKFEQYYIPRIKWTQNPDELSIIILNRHQNSLNLISFSTKSNEARLLLNETDSAYLKITHDLTFLFDNSFIWSSEKSGYNHLYHYDEIGQLKNQITSGPWEVTKYYGYDKKSGRVFYQSTEEGSINRTVSSVNISGSKKIRLSALVGNNSAAFSKSFNFFVNTYSNATTPTNYTLVDAKKGTLLKQIKNNLDMAEKLTEYKVSKKEFSTLETKNGGFNMWMIKPSDFDPDKKYPLLMFQYSGPGSQRVVNRYNDPKKYDYWHLMMAEKGYIIACVDVRGTGYRGRDFKKSTYLQLGKLEVADQIEAAKELGKRSYIDSDRIGIWGWSYGGFISSLAILKGAEVFKMAIAIAPVTDYRFYDSVYTERYMRTPQENPSGYEDNAPVNFAHLLKGDYLLVHGTGDDNVHVQNSMQMINSLVEANKDFEFFAYPDRAHGIRKGKNTRLHLFKKMTTFIDRSLGEPSIQNQFIID